MKNRNSSPSIVGQFDMQIDPMITTLGEENLASSDEDDVLQ